MSTFTIFNNTNENVYIPLVPSAHPIGSCQRLVLDMSVAPDYQDKVLPLTGESGNNYYIDLNYFNSGDFYLLDNGTKKCDQIPSSDFIVVPPSKSCSSTSDCSPYICDSQSGGCINYCKTDDMCSDGYTCNQNNRCINPNSARIPITIYNGTTSTVYINTQDISSCSSITINVSPSGELLLGSDNGNNYIINLSYISSGDNYVIVDTPYITCENFNLSNFILVQPSTSCPSTGCDPYSCDTLTNLCPTYCKSDSMCANGYACNSNQCISQQNITDSDTATQDITTSSNKTTNSLLIATGILGILILLLALIFYKDGRAITSIILICLILAIVIFYVVFGYFSGSSLTTTSNDYTYAYVNMHNFDPVLSSVDVSLADSNNFTINSGNTVYSVGVPMTQNVNAVGNANTGTVYNLNYVQNSLTTLDVYYSIGGVFTKSTYVPSLDIGNSTPANLTVYSSDMNGDTVPYVIANTGEWTNVGAYVGQILSVVTDSGTSSITINATNANQLIISVDENGDIQMEF